MTDQQRLLPICRFNPNHADLERWFGPLEAAIMLALWDAERPLTVKAVWRQLQRTYSAGVAYTTVMTTMTRLWEKAVLDRRKWGLPYCYTVRESRTEFEARQIHAIMQSAALLDELTLLRELAADVARWRETSDARDLRYVLDTADTYAAMEVGGAT